MVQSPRKTNNRKYPKKRCELLIAKRIADSLNEVEWVELEECMHGNEKAHQYYVELKKVWEMLEVLTRSYRSEIDIDKEWKRMSQALKEKNE
jgi:hypothetical protein